MRLTTAVIPMFLNAHVLKKRTLAALFLAAGMTGVAADQAGPSTDCASHPGLDPRSMLARNGCRIKSGMTAIRSRPQLPRGDEDEHHRDEAEDHAEQHRTRLAIALDITAAQPQRPEEPGKEGDCYEGDYC